MKMFEYRPHQNPFVSSEVETPEPLSRLRSIQTGFVLSILLLGLSACGLRPLYAGGESGATVQVLRSVTVAPIDGRSGWLLRNALNDRLKSGGDATSAFRLEIELDDQIAGFGVRRDDTITRERRTLPEV